MHSVRATHLSAFQLVRNALLECFESKVRPSRPHAHTSVCVWVGRGARVSVWVGLKRASWIVRLSRNGLGITLLLRGGRVGVGGERRTRRWVNEGRLGGAGGGAVKGKSLLPQNNLIPRLGWLFLTVSCSVRH